MLLEGVVTNVTNFGAFVDVGVHQDGLVHISMLADRFVKDPHEVVKAGDIVRVRVLEVDVERRRIGLSMRLEAPASTAAPSPAAGDAQQRDRPRGDGKRRRGNADPSSQRSGGQRDAPQRGTMADAFARARGRDKS
jgi:uncharacterized protein